MHDPVHAAWWKKDFDEFFPTPEKYKQPDRVLSQLQHIHNGDVVSEAINDYKDQRAEAEYSLNTAKHEYVEAFVAKIVKATERRVLHNIGKKIEKVIIETIDEQ